MFCCAYIIVDITECPADSRDAYTYIRQGSFTGTAAVLRDDIKSFGRNHLD